MYPFEIDFMRTLERQHQARMAEKSRQMQALKEAAEKVRY